MTPVPDSEVIAAVRAGETDRYGELIDRYERQVYAITWAHLGDATLAEDAAQEAFIRGFRHLGWLRDPDRFAGWLTRIARGIAINLGLRHRRELRRRLRWSVDPSIADRETEGPDGRSEASESAIPVELLRQALAELPARHRECLVLHYLERRSVAESAVLLGVTEGAFKVRLHRSRVALRGQLERRLADSLEQLGPRRRLAPAVLGSVAFKTAASDPTGLGSGLLATAGATLAKLVPTTVLFALLPFAALGAAAGTLAWVERSERDNFREPNGWDARHYVDNRNRGWLALALVGVVVLVMQAFGPALYHGVSEATVTSLRWTAAVILTLGAGGVVIASLRDYHLTRNRPDLLRTWSALPLFLGLAAEPVVHLDDRLLLLGFGLQMLGLALLPDERRLRFDDSLLLRAHRRLLPETGAQEPSRAPVAAQELFAFGRFLARYRLVSAYRRERDGYTFRLPAVEDLGGTLSLPWLRARDSVVRLGVDGRVEVRLGIRDRRALANLPDRADISGPDLEGLAGRVSEALASARIAFLSGDENGALSALGQRSARELFLIDPARTLAARVRRGVLTVAVFAGVVFLCRSFGWVP